jgi:hypothetical protein
LIHKNHTLQLWIYFRGGKRPIILGWVFKNQTTSQWCTRQIQSKVCGLRFWTSKGNWLWRNFFTNHEVDYNPFNHCIGFTKKMENQTSLCETTFLWRFSRRILHVTSKKIYTTKRKACLPLLEGNLWLEVSINGLVHTNWQFLECFGLIPNKSNHKLYFLVQGGQYVVLILYVDDLLLIGDNTRAWNPKTKLH